MLPSDRRNGNWNQKGQGTTRPRGARQTKTRPNRRPPEVRPAVKTEEQVIALLVGHTHAERQAPVGPGHDAAVLPDGTAWTVDTLVEGVHFAAPLTAEDVGWKSLMASVSDLGAIGARPAWALLSLSLPPADGLWAEGFARGFAAACAATGVALIGGDTTASPGTRFVSVSLGGPLVGPARTRGGARPGDVLWVSGPLGGAGLGWRDPSPPAAAVRALAHPEPPLAFALALASAGLATAAMDLSDGLSTDLPRLCAASGVGARVDASAVPLHPVLAGRDDAWAHAVDGGEDYALLFTANPAHSDRIHEVAVRTGAAPRPIGVITAGARVEVIGATWPGTAFRHFTAKEPA